MDIFSGLSLLYTYKKGIAEAVPFLSLDYPRQSDHVLDIDVIEALELFDLIVHLSLQAGCGCVVAFVEGVDEAREEANDKLLSSYPLSWTAT